MSAPLLSLLALAAGLLAGFAYQRPVDALSVLATLWVNALRMTVLPLVTALLITSTGTLRPAESGRTMTRALLLFLALLSGVGALTILLAPVAFSTLEIPAAERDALRAQWSTPGKAPLFSTWLTSLIPVNPLAAAAEGNLLAVIVFALALGLALATLPPAQAAPVLAFFHGLAAAMQTILRWVLQALPLGVFALAFQLATAGRAVSGALAFYLLLSVAVFLLVLAALYLLIAVTRPVPLLDFARALAPAQLVAFTSRSSLAALPLLVEAAHRLPLHRARATLLLPVALSLFRISAPASQILAVVFAAKLAGLPLAAPQLALAALLAILLAFSVPGVPNGSFLIMMPLFTTLGVPVEAIGLLLAVDLIPDLFKTIANVTAHLAAVCLLSSTSHSPEPSPLTQSS